MTSAAAGASNFDQPPAVLDRSATGGPPVLRVVPRAVVLAKSVPRHPLPRWLRTTLSTLVLVPVIALLAAVVWFKLTPWEARVVLTGSMQPRIPPGSLTVISPIETEEVLVGDVVSFRHPTKDAVFVHRVVDVVVDETSGETAFITRGDANTSPDAFEVTPAMVEGRVTRSWPELGSWILALLRPSVLRWLIGIPAGTVLGSNLIAIGRLWAIKRAREDERQLQVGLVIAVFAGCCVLGFGLRPPAGAVADPVPPDDGTILIETPGGVVVEVGSGAPAIVVGNEATDTSTSDGSYESADWDDIVIDSPTALARQLPSVVELLLPLLFGTALAAMCDAALRTVLVPPPRPTVNL